MTLHCRLFIPRTRLGKIFGNAFSICIHYAQIVLRWSRILCGGFFKPFVCFSQVLHTTFTITIHQSKIILRPDHILLGRFFIPFTRFYQIFRIFTPGIRKTKIILSLGITLLCQGL